MDDHKVLIGSVGACIAVVRLTWPTIFEKRRYPPGPWPWPVIGNGYAMFARSRAEYRYSKLSLICKPLLYFCICFVIGPILTSLNIGFASSQITAAVELTSNF